MDTNSNISINPHKRLLDSIIRDIEKQEKIGRRALEQYSPIIERVLKPVVQSFNQHSDTLRAVEEARKILLSSHKSTMAVIPRSRMDMSEEHAELIAEAVGKIMKKSKSKKKDEKIILYLGDDHIFYRNPKNKNQCTLEGRIQIGILKSLSDCGGEFTSTQRICREVGSKSEESIRKAIGIINRKGEIGLKLKNKIIESVRGRGYRLNQGYRIKFS